MRPASGISTRTVWKVSVWAGLESPLSRYLSTDSAYMRYMSRVTGMGGAPSGKFSNPRGLPDAPRASGFLRVFVPGLTEEGLHTCRGGRFVYVLQGVLQFLRSTPQRELAQSPGQGRLGRGFECLAQIPAMTIFSPESIRSLPKRLGGRLHCVRWRGWVAAAGRLAVLVGYQFYECLPQQIMDRGDMLTQIGPIWTGGNLPASCTLRVGPTHTSSCSSNAFWNRSISTSSSSFTSSYFSRSRYFRIACSAMLWSWSGGSASTSQHSSPCSRT